MAFKSGNPLDGKTVSPWTFDKVTAGTSFVAYKAGPTFWVNVHHMGASKPCVRILTMGDLPCAGCAAGQRVQWIGYQPLYNESHKPIVVGVKDYQQEVIDAIAPLAMVRVSRSKEHKAPVVVLPVKGMAPLQTARRDRDGKADLGPWLLHTLWGNRDLAKWVELHQEERAAKVEDRTEPPEIVEPDANAEFLRRLQSSSKKALEITAYEAVETGRILDFTLAETPVADRVRSNGKHKPKPK